MNEAWLPVVGWEGLYQVSDRGRVKSFHKDKRHGQYLTNLENGKGYLRLVLINKKIGKKEYAYVHALVLRAFRGEPAADQEARHGNGVRADNRLSNLSWGTRVQNAADRSVHGTLLRGSGHPNSRLTEDKVRELRASKATINTLCKRWGVSKATLLRARNGESWKHVS